MPRSRLVLLGDLLGDFEAAYAARHQAAETHQLRAPITGFQPIDRELGGALAPGLHVLQSAPGVGKTGFALQAAALCGFPALFVSCEQSALTLFERLIARETETDLSRITRGELPPTAVLDLACATAARLPHFGIVDASLEGVDVGLIEEVATTLRDATATSSLLLVIDSLQVWARGGMGAGLVSEYDLISMAVHSLRAAAIRLKSPVLLTCHRNRISQERGGLFSGLGSGQIEYGAEVVLELTRNMDVQPDRAGEVLVVLKILKNRGGGAGRSFMLLFSVAFQRFRVSAGPGTLSNEPEDFRSGRRGKP